MRGIPVALLACLALTACDKDEKKAIECIDPVDGQTITEADDIDPTPGIQIMVRCRVRGFELGDPLTLNVRDDITGTDRDCSLSYDSTGSVTFSPVTFQGGPPFDPAQYTLHATGSDGAVESNSVTVNVVSEPVGCPEFDFVDPVDGEEWNLSDDSNEDISDGFQHRVVITTDAGHDEEVTLLLDDALVGTGTVDGTRIEFTDVTFPPGGGAMTLRIRTEETCFAEATVTIDDTAPECAITAPAPTDGWINATYDTSTEAGMQADIIIETDGDANVELFVDTPLTDTPTLTGTADSAGDLVLQDVDLPEAGLGELTLQARCIDVSGNHTTTRPYEFGVSSS